MFIKANKFLMGATMAVALVLGGCVNEIDTVPTPEQEQTQPQSPYVEGELIVKFSPEVEAMLDAVTRSGGAATRSGIPSFDQVMETVGGYQLERVFPVDKRTEEQSRQRGLHLWYVVRFEGESIDAVARKFEALGEVQKVNPNRRIYRAYNSKAMPLLVSNAATRSTLSGAMNDPLLGKQWNLINEGDMFLKDGHIKSIKDADVQVEGAWQKSTGNSQVIVAVLDEGVYYNHPDLKANMWVNEGEVEFSTDDNDGNGYAGDLHGYNFVKGTGTITTDDAYDSGHGSHVAGIIAAVNNNGLGISSIAGGNGTADSGVKIMSCQIFSGVTGSSALAVCRAIKYAADNGAVVAQCSWGYISGEANIYDWNEQGFHTQEEWEQGAPLEKEAFDYFTHTAGSANGPIEGGIAIFAAGNESAPAAGYPGASDWAVAVTATSADFTPATYTNYGKGSVIAAPGGDQDYYWNYQNEGQNYGEEGCILSTLPYNISESGYGYMEGTSMACPHVSGVAALAISYAADKRIHLKATELRELLIAKENTTPIDDYMTGTKIYRRYVADIGPIQPMSMNLDNYRGQMGNGQVNATKLLAAIDGVGVPMRFPNIYVGEGQKCAVVPAHYFVDGEQMTFSVTIADNQVASCSQEGGKLVFEGLKSGTTTATLIAKGTTTEQHTFTITVRKGADGSGWL